LTVPRAEPAVSYSVLTYRSVRGSRFGHVDSTASNV